MLRPKRERFLKELSSTHSAFWGNVEGAKWAAGKSTYRRNNSLRKGFNKCSTLQENKEWKRIIKSLAGELLEVSLTMGTKGLGTASSQHQEEDLGGQSCLSLRDLKKEVTASSKP